MDFEFRLTVHELSNFPHNCSVFVKCKLKEGLMGFNSFRKSLHGGPSGVSLPQSKSMETRLPSSHSRTELERSWSSDASSIMTECVQSDQHRSNKFPLTGLFAREKSKQPLSIFPDRGVRNDQCPSFDRTVAMRVVNNTALFNWTFQFKVVLRVDEASNEVCSQFLTLDVIETAQGGSKTVTLGVVRINLAEFAAARHDTTRRYLLQKSTSNSSLRLTISSRQLSGDSMYRVPSSADTHCFEGQIRPGPDNTIFDSVVGVLGEDGTTGHSQVLGNQQHREAGLSSPSVSDGDEDAWKVVDDIVRSELEGGGRVRNTSSTAR